MSFQPEKRPAWNPNAGPIKLKCDATRVFGWVYPDGTIELICEETIHKRKRPGQETRHLFNPQNGEHFPVYVDKPKK